MIAQYNKKIKIRNRLLELKWTTQLADHFMDNFINNNSTHDLTFQEASNSIAKGVFKSYKKNIYHAYCIANERKYLAVLLVTPNFVIVKTIYRNGWNIK